MPVRWTADMNEKLLLAIIEQNEQLKADWARVAERLGQGLKAGAVREQFRVLRKKTADSSGSGGGGSGKDGGTVGAERQTTSPAATPTKKRNGKQDAPIGTPKHKKARQSKAMQDSVGAQDDVDDD